VRPDGFNAVLVDGHDSRLRGDARPGGDASAQIHFQPAREWAGPARRGNGIITKKPYVVLCGLCTLLVFTVSSIVVWTSAPRNSRLARDHLPLYFVIGAVFCGFGMILVLLIPVAQMVQARAGHHPVPTWTRSPS